MRTANGGAEPLWYKDAIIYELHVRAFYDSNADGIGDFSGLARKLDYLKDLGVSVIWLLPFYPSPLKDDGYDISDYTNINQAYGTLQAFKEFLREAHKRGLRVITELVLNHTSDQHAWFSRAQKARTGSAWRDFYVWNQTPDKYNEARVIFKDFEHSNWTWDPVAQAYYWHRFYSHQPDLNFDNPRVWKSVLQVLDFWLRLGVDGLRLDAVPYLYEREGTDCENLPETHELLKKLRGHVEANYKDRVLLAEANQWPEDASAYFGSGDECQMAFHFPLMPRLFMSIRMEDRFPVIDILSQTPHIPDGCQWALFLRNHDELTLEMVTDEERDYMYRVYASDREARLNLGIRRRLAPLLGNHRRRIELMNGLLFALPGTPVLYYGDEIGMGDNIYLGDRNGVRTPMQWSADRNAGFSQANTQKLYLPVITDPEYHYETVNVETQQNNPHSLLWWTRRLIALRNRHKAFGRGSLEFLHPENRKVLAFIRRYDTETVLVVANLSRFVQYVELNLEEFKRMIPVEMFGQNEFPPIGELPYLLTIGAHSFYWFTLQPSDVTEGAGPTGDRGQEVSRLSTSGEWKNCLKEPALLRDALPKYLQLRRWFGGKAKQIRKAEIVDAIPVKPRYCTAQLLLVKVEYTDGDPETYSIPVSFASGEGADQLASEHPSAIIASIQVTNKGTAVTGVLYESLWDPCFPQALLETISRRLRLKGSHGLVMPLRTAAYGRVSGSFDPSLRPSLPQSEQSNTSLVYGDRFILKLFRRIGSGPNPEIEVGRFLTEKALFTKAPQLAGALEYRPERGEVSTLASLHTFVQSEGDAWHYTLDMVKDFYEQSLVGHANLQETPPVSVQRKSLIQLSSEEAPDFAREMIGTYLESARLLGQRTAELHLALASDASDPAFAPEQFSALYRRSVYQSIRSMAIRVLGLLRRQLARLPDGDADARRVLGFEEKIIETIRSILSMKITALRTRYHGDYHLGQVLYTGNDFFIIDFEGEPERPIGERRTKRSPLCDVASMIRSFHYAAWAPLLDPSVNQDLAGTPPVLEQWAQFWYRWVSSRFLEAYVETAGDAPFIPSTEKEFGLLLNTYLVEKAVYELGYELNNRPSWVKIPLRGLIDLIETEVSL